jgi:4-amino-4-deoxy-L-arabinose transferase-like glycosyltransferase
LSWLTFLGIAAYAGSLLLVHVGPTRVLNHHEVIFAQPAREMLASGSWIVPRFSGVPSTHKPPGTNWLIALSMFVTGSQAEWAVRLPTALAGVGTALLVAAMAARWFGSRVGIVAGLIQASSYYVLLLAHTAEADMLLTMFVTGAMFCFAAGTIHSPCGLAQAKWLPWLFYALLACAFLIKALLAVYIILGGCGAFVLASRDWRGLRFLLNPVGVSLFLICCGAWSAAAYSEHPEYLDTQVLHHFGRLKGEMGRDGQPLFYVQATLLMLLPWTPLVVAGALRGLRNSFWRAPLWRFVACWFVVGMVLLVACPFQRKHYLAPLLPPLSFIAALALLEYVRLRIGNSLTMHALQGISSLAACVAGAAAIAIVRCCWPCWLPGSGRPLISCSAAKRRARWPAFLPPR